MLHFVLQILQFPREHSAVAEALPDGANSFLPKFNRSFCPASRSLAVPANRRIRMSRAVGWAPWAMQEAISCCRGVSNSLSVAFIILTYLDTTSILLFSRSLRLPDSPRFAESGLPSSAVTIWNGRVSDPKTRKGRAPVPVIRQLADRLEMHRLRSGNPLKGPIFANSLGNPLSLGSVVNRVICPTLNRCEACGKAESVHQKADHPYKRDAKIPEWQGCPSAR